MDSVSENSAGEWLLTQASGLGMVHGRFQPPQTDRRFWMEGDLFFESNPRSSAAYYLFGFYEADSLYLWAAGYRLETREILFGRVERDGLTDSMRLQKFAAKPVEIVNLHRKYVYKLIFLHETREIKVEINGVPMLAPLPFSPGQLTHFGYMIDSGSLRCEPFELRGD